MSVDPPVTYSESDRNYDIVINTDFSITIRDAVSNILKPIIITNEFKCLIINLYKNPKMYLSLRLSILRLVLLFGGNKKKTAVNRTFFF